MRLVNEAIRDIMLYLEQNLNHTSYEATFENDVISYNKLAKELTPSDFYTATEVKYAAIQLVDAGFILAHKYTGKKDNYIRCDIYDITYAGHELIKNIKPKKIWQKVKTQAEKEGILSLTNLAKLCSKTTALMLSNATISQIPQNILDDIFSPK